MPKQEKPKKPSDIVTTGNHLAALARFTRTAGPATPFRPTLLKGGRLSAEMVDLLDKQCDSMRGHATAGKPLPLDQKTKAALDYFGYDPGLGAQTGDADNTLDKPGRGGAK